VPALPARARYGPGIAAGILITSMLLPPVAAYAAVRLRAGAAVPDLRRRRAGVAGAGHTLAQPPADLAARQRRTPSWTGGRAAIRLVAFIALVISWRLPFTVNALARNPGLVAAEMVTLLAAGTGVWLELVSTPTAPGRLSRPACAAMAAAARWTIWVLAYLTGMSGASWFAA
jgi:hypothetical protein